VAEIDLTEPVTIRSSRGEEFEVPRGALPGFLNQGFEVLKSDGSVNPKPVTPKAV
jgi:hypothetical protein